ncbi:acyl-CoA dehydrogenase family protein [Nocardioides sp. Kera G14]|uniref:acyl-CoA dehydrogenase family protein n=1 Tax=Nocardioides sp. Kera G14 TaxID=2884264 RepID=UPI001D0FC2D5|nr:acyl-CoA dehydrogenase family protein [Nocardioides sp. Kera G14]UDY22598.1 acyl-CoA dehydrogenase family protein [Nocardioides sp. Kera G14]
MSTIGLQATELTAAERELQAEVRAWLDERLPEGGYPIGLGMVGHVDPEFSRDLGAKGWLGMALPQEYGGGGRTAVERLVVVEELLARGAPVGHHWIADRQSGPSIALHGTPAQKQEFLPRIASGELCFAIGMSEPDSGSDLASIRSKAEPTERDGVSGWVINGSKIWTSGAHIADYILGLFRTGNDKHAGLTQFIIDRETEGLRIDPIPFIDGELHFCLLTFEDVFVPDSRRLGEVGWGWMQNQGELVLERGGVDRWMSAMPVLERWVQRELATDAAADARLKDDLAGITSRCWAFHGMSLAVARMVDAGELPKTEAALVKDMATRFEQECIEIVVRHLGRMPDPTSEDPFEALLATAVLSKPSWTIRGGTTEILHNLIAKELRR